MESKEEKNEIIVATTPITKFNEMLNDFNTQFSIMTEKFKRINDCNKKIN